MSNPLLKGAVEVVWRYLDKQMLDRAEAGRLLGYRYVENLGMIDVEVNIPEAYRMLSKNIHELKAKWLKEARAAGKEAGDA